MSGFSLAYETYGQLNASRDNAMLVIHALTGDAHAAGYHGAQAGLVGPDPGSAPVARSTPTATSSVLANVLGGCSGSTGPCDINPATGRRWGKDFPLTTVPDLVRAQKLLIERLGIRRLAAVIGGSLGGMQALDGPCATPRCSTASGSSPPPGGSIRRASP